MGCWVTYGLGSESESLPAYVVMPDPKGALEGGQPMYANGFLPANFQPTHFRPGNRPVLNLSLPEGVPLEQRRRRSTYSRFEPGRPRAGRRRIHARINAYDLAFKCKRRHPRFSTFRANPRTRSIFTVSGRNQPTTTGDAACSRGDWSRMGCDLFVWFRGEALATCNGTRTMTSKKIICAKRRNR